MVVEALFGMEHEKCNCKTFTNVMDGVDTQDATGGIPIGRKKGSGQSTWTIGIIGNANQLITITN